MAKWDFPTNIWRQTDRQTDKTDRHGLECEAHMPVLESTCKVAKRGGIKLHNPPFFTNPLLLFCWHSILEVSFVQVSQPDPFWNVTAAQKCWMLVCVPLISAQQICPQGTLGNLKSTTPHGRVKQPSKCVTINFMPRALHHRCHHI